MKKLRITPVVGALVLLGATACADLVVDNTNNPDRRRALATPGDVEGLISGGFRQWFQANYHVSGPGMFFSNQSFQHSSTAANFGMLQYSRFPREAVQNSVTHADYTNISYSWDQNYRAIAGVSEGLRAINTDPAISSGLGTTRVLRARLYAKLVQGLAHGDLAMLYDQAYIVDESVATIDENGAPILLGTPASYTAVANAAIGYLNEAIALATSPAAASITIPGDWMGMSTAPTAAEIARIASSRKAQIRAYVGRTPAERAAANWSQILAEVGAGVRTDWNMDVNYIRTTWVGGSWTQLYQQASTWQQVTMFVLGMADQSGNYQAWLAMPLADRRELFPASGNAPVLIISPDLRFPRGTTIEQHRDSPGLYVGIRRACTAAGAIDNGVQYTSADRGTWRWSQYYIRKLDASPAAGSCVHATSTRAINNVAWAMTSYAEMRFLAAEAQFRLGNLDAAADSINVTRVAVGGLAATNAAGLNTSCVPKLPNGSCGNLFEMLKWEKRLEAWATGPYGAIWWFDSRGWGDLYRGTPLQLPIPDAQHQVLGLGPAYTFGGVGGTMGAPRSTYQYPGE